jgi:peptide/nickel transport system substrate-binding protein
MKLPALKRAQDTFDSFSYTGRAVFLSLACVCVVSAAALLYLLNSSLLIEVPARGGSWSEGLVGSPRFINPVLAVSDSDHDLTTLVYSGLLKATPEGDYVPDLAASYTISPDGKTYTFTLRQNAVFQDGTPVTADDVLFTIQKIENPTLKSPLYPNWQGVTASTPDAHTVVFTLESPYAPFIENLTLGILPKHLWQNVSDDEFSFSDLNTSPVGSGPFEVASIEHSSSGIPSSYDLKPFGRYALGAPYLNDLTLHFYQNEAAVETALKGGDVSAASGISPAALESLKGFTVKTAPLDRIFAVFFNQNQSAVLRDHDVRAALNAALDRQALVSQVLAGYGEPLDGPVPPNLLGDTSATSAAAATSSDPALAPRAALLKAGWSAGPAGVLQKTTGKGKNASTETLTFTLATDNVPELRAAAQYAVAQWQKMGAQVSLQVYDQGDLSQNVIRPRKYDALLFGEIVGREADLYAFWDSSERNDPGLNIALYANPAADKILSQLRTTDDDATRQKLYAQFESQLEADIPAVFLYAPSFVYIVPNDIEGLNLGFIETPSDRFLSADNWHFETDYVWPFVTHL